MVEENIVIDDVDKKIINLLTKNAALTNQEIAHHIQLSPSATHERIKKLHSNGVIKKIIALVDARSVEMSLCAFIYVLIDTPSHSKSFLQAIVQDSAVMECHHITGEYSYLLKVRVKDTQHLESFITGSLKSHDGVTRTLTQIVLSSSKDGDTVID